MIVYKQLKTRSAGQARGKQSKKRIIPMKSLFLLLILQISFMPFSFCSDCDPESGGLEGHSSMQHILRNSADTVMVELAYSDQRFKNVGALYEVYQFSCCSPKRYLVGSVVYLGGRTCLMSVNCFKSRSMEFFLSLGLMDHLR